MASAANNDAYGNSAWGGGPQGAGPWGNPGSQQRGWQNHGWQQTGGWTPSPFWYPVGISRPMAILFTVLGFIFWWPVGLVILFYMLATGRGRRHAWQGANGGWQEGGGWTAPWKSQWTSWCGGGPPSGRSSGNHAFDEYKAETLRRLEDEQKEFGAFLDRLRFAKDKAEFDQFMAERRHRPPSPPTPSPAPDRV
jgi:hypothetical protein